MFNATQIKLMRKIGLKMDLANPDRLSDNEWVLIEKKVGDYLNSKCLDIDYKPNSEGIVCYSILDMLP